ncbi:hypothetical protein ACQ4PT_009833 [Festuca glaucescens]
MASSVSNTEKAEGALSPRAARAKLEELGRLDITDEEATPLVIDDRDDDPKQKWSLAGKPSELKFDRLSLWARIMNLPFNLRDKKWWLPIAQQIDKKVKEVQFDHVGGFLRARVTIDIANPLRRWVLIDSAKRKSVDLYEIQYEHVPHFCFSCGRLGHPDTLCPSPGNRDENGKLPFGKGLRASDDWKKASYSEGSTGSSQNRKVETRNSSNAATARTEATSPLKKNQNVKRKAETQQKVYRRVEASTAPGKYPGWQRYDCCSV